MPVQQPGAALPDPPLTLESLDLSLNCLSLLVGNLAVQKLVQEGEAFGDPPFAVDHATRHVPTVPVSAVVLPDRQG